MNVDPVAPRPWADALAWIDSQPAPTATDDIPARDACGRVASRDLPSARDLPAARVSAADGYAVRASHTYGASDYNPLSIPLTDGTGPGATLLQAGDPLPAGADTVVPLECVDAHDGFIVVSQPCAVGDNVAEPGEDCRTGSLLVAKNARLLPARLALLTMAGISHVPVWRQPRVRLVTAGRFDQDGDSPMLAALIERDGGVVESSSHARDDEELATTLTAPGADLIMTVGGTGGGPADSAVAVARRLGTVDIHRVAINPGGHVTLARLGASHLPAVLLPGTPLACFAAYELLASRLVRRWSRLVDDQGPHRHLTAPLASKAVSVIGQRDLCRVRVHEGVVTPVAIADDRRLSTVTSTDGFVVIPESSEGYPAGTMVDVQLYD